jgi:hypothetical protein
MRWVIRIRWMENGKDREWLPLLKGQNRHARTPLERAVAAQGAAGAYRAAIARQRADERRAAR